MPEDEHLVEEYVTGVWEDSPLTNEDRTAIREVVNSVYSAEDRAVCIDLSHIDNPVRQLNVMVNGPVLSLDLYVDEEKTNKEILPNERYADVGLSSPAEVNPNPDYLRNLGSQWKSLEGDIISTVVKTLGLPSNTDKLHDHTFDDVGFLCISADGTTAMFGDSYDLPMSVDAKQQSSHALAQAE